jgi:hypothetical protein
LLAAKIRHMPVVGADHPLLERRVIEAAEADPRGRDEEMDVGALVVHVGDAVRRGIILNAAARHSAATPARLASRMRVARRGLAKDAAIVFCRHAVIVQPGMVFIRPARQHTVRRQFGEPRAKVGVDIALQNLGRR